MQTINELTRYGDSPFLRRHEHFMRWLASGLDVRKSKLKRIEVRKYPQFWYDDITVFSRDEEGDIDWCNHAGAYEDIIVSDAGLDNETVQPAMICNKCGKSAIIYGKDEKELGEWL